jgi:acyl dehydratase
MHARISRRIASSVLPVAGFSVACFSSPDFASARSTATRFARALAAGDTVEMRQLSLPEAGKRMVQLRSELPAAYTVFADPERAMVTVSGGGIYGSGAETVFRIPSLRLQSCDGGLELSVIKSGGSQRVSFVRPVPPIDSLTGDACRAALAASETTGA